jgi:hypothetical protein
MTYNFFKSVYIKSVYYILISVCCLSFSCHNQKQRSGQDGDSAIQQIKWKSQKDFEIKDLVEDIQYILLENKTECLFSEISKLIIENDRIYILDMYETKSLFVFDITGKFLHKVGGVGGGPGEYTRYIFFDVYDNMVYVCDISKHRMLIYDENGKFVKYEESSFVFDDFYILEQKKYLLSLNIYEDNNAIPIIIKLQLPVT